MNFKKKINLSVDKVDSAILKGIYDGIEEICSIVEADAVLNVHVDTGELKKSISYEVEQDKKSTTGTVGSNMEYAIWEDLRHPYLSYAVDKNLGSFDSIMQKNIKQKVGE